MVFLRKLGKKGQGTVEFALAVFVFFAFMVVLTDMVRICYNWVCLQYAVNEAARIGSVSAPAGTDRASVVSTEVTRIATHLGVKNVTIAFSDSGGSSLGFFELQAQSPIVLNPLSGLILKIAGDFDGTYIVTAETLIRNEPFV